MGDAQDRRSQGDKGYAQGLRVLMGDSISAATVAPVSSIPMNILPGIIDVKSATYDNPDAVPARAHIQVADRIGWMERAN
jgi:hypothetical protein